MSFEAMLIGGLVCALIYFASMSYIGVRMDTKKRRNKLINYINSTMPSSKYNNCFVSLT